MEDDAGGFTRSLAGTSGGQPLTGVERSKN